VNALDCYQAEQLFFGSVGSFPVVPIVYFYDGRLSTAWLANVMTPARRGLTFGRLM